MMIKKLIDSVVNLFAKSEEETVQLDVPYIKQPNNSACGRTALSMCMAYYGTEKVVMTIKEYQNSIDNDHKNRGSTHKTLLDTARHYGFTETEQFTGWPTLIEKIKAEHPCLINIKSVINLNSGHYAVVTGLTFNTEGKVKKIFLNDPSGGHKKYSKVFFNILWVFRKYWGMNLK